MKYACWFLVLLLLAYAVDARARCCNGDGDCPRGFACLAAAPGSSGSCSSALAVCSCDADCPQGLRCMPAARTMCVQSGLDAGQTCLPAGLCAAPWQIPCATSADCGPGGFRCVQSGTLCTASGCQTTSSCAPPTLPDTCASDADCPTAWSCLPDTAADTLCVWSGHSCPANGCPAPTGQMLCRPPLWELVGGNSWTGSPVPATACSAVDGGSNSEAAAARDGGSPLASASAGATAPAVGSSGGCQIDPRGGAGGSWLAFPGILVWALRRRR